MVRDHATLVTRRLAPEAEAVAAGGRRRGTPATCGHLEARSRGRCVPRGAFQRRNFAVAAAAAEAFLGGPTRRPCARPRTVVVPGRLEIDRRRSARAPSTALTTRRARQALAEALPEIVEGRPLIGVVAILDDKDAAAMLAALLPLFERVVFTRAATRGRCSPATLESLASQLDGPPSETVARPAARPSSGRASWPAPAAPC